MQLFLGVGWFLDRTNGRCQARCEGRRQSRWRSELTSGGKLKNLGIALPSKYDGP